MVQFSVLLFKASDSPSEDRGKLSIDKKYTKKYFSKKKKLHSLFRSYIINDIHVSDCCGFRFGVYDFVKNINFVFYEFLQKKDI